MSTMGANNGRLSMWRKDFAFAAGWSAASCPRSAWLRCSGGKLSLRKKITANMVRKVRPAAAKDGRNKEASAAVPPDNKPPIAGPAMNTHEHFDAERMLVELRQDGHRVGRATVYRTLPLLENCGIIKEVSLGQKQTFYEHIHGHGQDRLAMQCPALRLPSWWPSGSLRLTIDQDRMTQT